MWHRVLLSLALLPAAFPADWDQHPFPAWNDRAVMRLLTDSAWSKQRTVALSWKKREDNFDYRTIVGADHNGQPQTGSPVGGIGARKSHLPDRASILLRWSNSLVMRQAKALYQLRDDKLPESKLNELIGVPESAYVLEVFGLPAEIAWQGTGTMEANLMKSAVLQTKSGRVIKPVRVTASAPGLQLRVFLYFPKSPGFTLADKTLEFRADFELFKVKETFSLGDMVYQGALDL